MTPVRLEPAASRSRVKHSTTEPLRFLSDLIHFLLFQMHFHVTGNLVLYSETFPANFTSKGFLSSMYSHVSLNVHAAVKTSITKATHEFPQPPVFMSLPQAGIWNRWTRLALLTLYALMDSSFWLNTMDLGWSILSIYLFIRHTLSNEYYLY